MSKMLLSLIENNEVARIGVPDEHKVAELVKRMSNGDLHLKVSKIEGDIETNIGDAFVAPGILESPGWSASADYFVNGPRSQVTNK